MAQLTTFAAVRNSFWDAHPQFKKDFRVNKRQNEYCTDIRCAFVDYVDYLHRDGQITDKLANNVTL